MERTQTDVLLAWSGPAPRRTLGIADLLADTLMISGWPRKGRVAVLR